jgi:hypothetical protein
VQQYCCGGLNFGYFYAGSPIIAYDGDAHPTYTMYEFTQSSVPGCRAPHLWLDARRSLYDMLGPGYTLLRFDPTVGISGVVKASSRHRVPLTILDIDAPDALVLYAPISRWCAQTSTWPGAATANRSTRWRWLTYCAAPALCRHGRRRDRRRCFRVVPQTNSPGVWADT